MSSDTLQNLRRGLSVVLLAIGLLVAVTTLRMMLDGHRHLEAATERQRAGDRPSVLRELESAAKAYVPGGPYTTRALEELEILAKGAEMRGENEAALATWDLIRRSILATRHVYQPNAERLATAEKEVVRLSKSDSRSGSKTLSRIERPADPSVVATVLLSIGIFAWIGGAVLILGTVKKDNISKTARAVMWLMCLGGLALWLGMVWIAG